jgi:probable phosphoglycerate mutase
VQGTYEKLKHSRFLNLNLFLNLVVVKQVILVRHGETVHNKQGLVSGHLPTPLTAEGVLQARRIGEAVRDENITKIYSSDLLRAKQTTDEIVKGVNAAVQYSEALRERTWGVLDGVTRDEYLAAVRLSGHPLHEFRPEGGESILDVQRRAVVFIKRLVALQSDEETILISSHEVINKTLIFYFSGRDVKDWRSISQENGCINRLTFTPNNDFSTITMNDIRHLV